MDKRNVKIDFLKLALALMIMFYHARIFPMHYGWYCVDIFFVISGAMLARTASVSKENSVVEETCRYMKTRYCRFWRLILPAFFLVTVSDTIYFKLSFGQCCKRLFLSIPEMLFIDRAGLITSESFYVGASWYLSVVILTDLILYPVLLKNYNAMVNIVCPGLFIFGITFLYTVAGGIKFESVAWLPFVRGFVEMSLGCFCYAMAIKTKNTFTLTGKVLCSGWIIMICGVFTYILFSDTVSLEILIVELILMGSVLIIILGGNDIFPIRNNHNICFEGEYLYVTHLFVIDIWKRYFGSFSQIYYSISMIMACILMAILYKNLVERFWLRYDNKLKSKIFIQK